jgi:hypothetical protein
MTQVKLATLHYLRSLVTLVESADIPNNKVSWSTIHHHLTKTCQRTNGPFGPDEITASFFNVVTSFADPGYLSRILIFTHSGSRIPDPKTAKRGVKKNLLSNLFL